MHSFNESVPYRALVIGSAVALYRATELGAVLAFSIIVLINSTELIMLNSIIAEIAKIAWRK